MQVTSAIYSALPAVLNITDCCAGSGALNLAKDYACQPTLYNGALAWVLDPYRYQHEVVRARAVRLISQYFPDCRHFTTLRLAVCMRDASKLAWCVISRLDCPACRARACRRNRAARLPFNASARR